LYRGDSVLTGQGRIFTLYMFQSHEVCDVTALLHFSSGRTATVDLKMEELPPRIVCDPIVYYDRIQNLCRSGAETGLTNADLFMRVRRSTEAGYRTVIDESKFCNPVHRYSILHDNPWIR